MTVYKNNLLLLLLLFVRLLLTYFWHTVSQIIALPSSSDQWLRLLSLLFLFLFWIVLFFFFLNLLIPFVFFSKRNGKNKIKREERITVELDYIFKEVYPMQPLPYNNPGGAAVPQGSSVNYSAPHATGDSSQQFRPPSFYSPEEGGGSGNAENAGYAQGTTMNTYAAPLTSGNVAPGVPPMNQVATSRGGGAEPWYTSEGTASPDFQPGSPSIPAYSMGGVPQGVGQGSYPNDPLLSQEAGSSVPKSDTGMQYAREENFASGGNTEGSPEEEDEEEPEVRWSWKMFPSCQLVGATKYVPLGCMYTPLRRKTSVLSLVGDRCSRCKAFLNPYVRVDVRTQTWFCALCQESNVFSSRYDTPITEYNLPLPLQPGNETVEYIEPKQVPPNQTYVLLVDLCVDDDKELEGLKSILKMVVEKLPSNVFIALVTFSITIQLHKLKESKALGPRVIALRGTDEIKQEDFKKLITNILSHVVQLNVCREYINELIDGLQRDPWPVPKSHRPLRCTGAALSFVTTLLELFAPSRGSTIFAFLSGPCTVGPGMVVQPSRECIIRSHRDIKESNANATLWFSSCSYYDALMQRLVSQGHTFSCFCASLDQLGVGELKQCIGGSGGVVFNAETWLQESFYQSIELFLEPDENGKQRFAMNASFEVLTSPTWKVAGVIGQCIGAGKTSDMVSDIEIGYGHTQRWITGMIDAYTTYAVYFTIPDSSSTFSLSTAVSVGSSSSLLSFVGVGGNKEKSIAPYLSIPYRYVQFITRYELDSEIRVRVTTICHPQSQTPSKQELIQAFDQETAAVLLAREAIFKTDSTALFTILRWLDSQLVGVVAAFGEPSNQPPRPGSSPMRLPPQCVFFPAFMYHLRRSGYLQIFNSSPDEAAIIRLQFLRSNVRDSIVQIQPTLYRYRMDAPAEPVPLDSSALQPDCVVLLDTFFEVLLHSGSTIAAWRSAGYAEKEEYAFFKEFLDVCLADAQMLVMGRVPVPRLIDACQDDPDARILYNRINPSRSYNSPPANGAAEVYGQQEGELIYTDDVSLQTFMSHLWKVAAEMK